MFLTRSLSDVAGAAFLVLGAFLVPTSTFAAEPPIRVLLLSGKNNHDWHATTPRLMTILETSGRFTVEVTEHPENLDEATLAKYDVLVSNWNNFGTKDGDWSEPTREAYVKFVRAGHGVVTVHAGSSSFNNWEDYQKIAGGAWGEGTGHGHVHQFTVKIADPDHPITRGMVPFQTRDELWHRTWSITEKHVLATAFSTKEQGGSGADEPVAFTTAFGKGRGFMLVLGHDVQAMESPGFQALLRRGTEWAATTKVTLKDGTAQIGGQTDALLASAGQYKLGDDRKALMAIESLVAAVSPGPVARKELAAKLATNLSGTATVEAKQFFCTQLSLVGSAAEVPALARLLADTNFACQARLALERIPGEESVQALRAAVAKSSGPGRVGLIHSLATKHSEATIPDLAELVADVDSATAGAAASALAKIETPSAAKALLAGEAKAPSAAKAAVSEALLACAEALFHHGVVNEAMPILRRLVTPSNPQPVRLAASALLLSQTATQGSGPLLGTLLSDDPTLRASAVLALKRASSAALLREAAALLPKIPVETRVQLLSLLAEHPAPACLPAVTDALASKEPEVKAASLRAIAALGDATSVPVLAAVLPGASPEERALITETLTALGGAGVDEAVAQALKESTLDTARVLMRVLVNRASGVAVDALKAQLDDPAPEVRRDALAGLGKLARLELCPALISRLEKAPPGEIDALQSALAEICKRYHSDAPIQSALAEASPAKRVLLLEVLGSIGGPGQAQALIAGLKDPNEPVRSTAVRLLANWPDATPLDALLAAAADAPDARTKAIALRGVARLAPLAKDQPLDQLVSAITKAMSSAAPAEQKLLLAGLGEMPSVPAMNAALEQLQNPQLAPEARSALFKILEQLGPEHRAEARPALARLKQVSHDPGSAAQLEALDFKFGDYPNLALGATATNLDGLTSDGEGQLAPAAIDGNPRTYWDEVDNQKLYDIQVKLREPARVALLRIMGWQQHNYAPKDFEVLCDTKVVRKVENAQYHDNWFTVALPPTQCSAVELRITGYYGSSPAIRELEIYGGKE